MILSAAHEMSARIKLIHYTRKTRVENSGSCFYYVTTTNKNKRIWKHLISVSFFSFHIVILFQNYLAIKTRPYSIIAKKADNIQTQTKLN